jgi:hypothetical protein
MLRYNKTDLAGLTNDADAALYEAKDLRTEHNGPG